MREWILFFLEKNDRQEQRNHGKFCLSRFEKMHKNSLDHLVKNDPGF